MLNAECMMFGSSKWRNLLSTKSNWLADRLTFIPLVTLYKLSNWLRHIFNVIHYPHEDTMETLRHRHICSLVSNVFSKKYSLCYLMQYEVKLTYRTPDAIDPFYWHGLTLIPAWINNYTHYKVWDEITYPFPNFNGGTVEVWEWINNFTPHFTGHVITYPWQD